VRLAQRVPVRIALDQTPADLRMIAGRTATVAVLGLDGKAQSGKVKSGKANSGGDQPGLTTGAGR
jgi:multidrug resistance efflux pump